MSELKFACPVCGQHITCDSGSSGSAMACPTCFRQLVVPQATVPGASGLVLAASEVQTRVVPLSGNMANDAGPALAAKPFPWAAAALGFVVCLALAAGFVFRDAMFSGISKTATVVTNAPLIEPVATSGNTNWTLNLAAARIPTTPVAGEINGQAFVVQRATIKGGMLVLWLGTKWPPDSGMAVDFFAKQPEELAGKTVVVEATRANAPRVLVRWQDAQGQKVTQEFHEGYALRVEFEAIRETRLPGKIFLAAPDAGRSYLAGVFDAEIHKSSSARHNQSN